MMVIVSCFLGLTASAQVSNAFIGNTTNFCSSDSTIVVLNSLPADLGDYEAIFIFSNASSGLSDSDVAKIINYAESGGGLYLGAENWPLQAESNQITEKLYLKSSYGSYDQEIADNPPGGNLKLNELDTIPAGRSTVAFPLDYRLKVEAWVDDQPLIQSGQIGEGRIIVDGGYSRFYCDQRNNDTDSILVRFINYLTQKQED